MTREAFIHGIYPRSETLVDLTRGLERGRVGEDEVRDQQIREAQGLINLQRDSHFAYVEDGKLTWQDILRPIVKSTVGFGGNVDTRPVTRLFDNNTFYRKPLITGPLQLDPELLDYYLIDPQSGEWKVTLLSPYAFAQLCEDATTDNFRGTLENVTGLTKQIIDHLATRGVRMVQLNEPYVPYHGNQETEIDDLAYSLALLDRSGQPVKIATHFYFGDAAPIVRELVDRDIGVDAVGVDFYRTSLKDLPTDCPYEVVAGIVKGRNSLLEDQSDLARFVAEIEAALDPVVLYLSHNSDLELLPERVAREKVELLSRLRSG